MNSLHTSNLALKIWFFFVGRLSVIVIVIIGVTKFACKMDQTETGLKLVNFYNNGSQCYFSSDNKPLELIETALLLAYIYFGYLFRKLEFS